MEKDIMKNNDQINRREALAKSGKYAAFTALTMLTILSPRKAIAGDSTAQKVDKQSPSKPGSPPSRPQPE